MRIRRRRQKTDRQIDRQTEETNLSSLIKGFHIVKIEEENCRINTINTIQFLVSTLLQRIDLLLSYLTTAL